MNLFERSLNSNWLTHISIRTLVAPLGLNVIKLFEVFIGKSHDEFLACEQVDSFFEPDLVRLLAR